jgi:hypothetical protein
MPQDWYGTLDAIASGSLDPMPSVGRIIGLDEVPAAIDLARRSDGPPRIIVHPNAGASEAKGNVAGASEATGNVAGASEATGSEGDQP